ncbi:phosphofurin acidic cluster sorting protein 1-like isoform X12 [Betta splendens]|uniref:Phosphofurin acidic cluster sorting protein 1-like isoform X12 n=1 Tax=Betta splendens TaxID=158456 RepID=A0A6P7MVD3_BETSP|nr:phosphofurin acidic cluster sorting protein 1-like isoform X12 [Betta splendens]
MAADAGGARAVFPTVGSTAGTGSDATADEHVPVPTSLFATWEVERSSPSCVPRLCSLTVRKLMVLRDLGRELGSIVIAVKIQGSKRTLRSNEYLVPPDGMMETDLELSFSLQYLHFLKRDVNRLHVMLQRRKTYRNRTILGYKTLAVGVVDMAEVMQHPMDRAHILCLHSNRKDACLPAAELIVLSLSSQPVEQEDASSHGDKKSGAPDHFPDVENNWEDDDSFSSEQEGSDDTTRPQGDANVYVTVPRCAQGEFDDNVRGKTKTSRRTQVLASPSCTYLRLDSDPQLMSGFSVVQQPNFKQKFSALLKNRFRVSDEVLNLDPVDQEPEAEEDLDLLYHSLDSYNLSDSGPELDDSDSIVSTPKPKLRPFFEETCQSSSWTTIESEKKELRASAAELRDPDESRGEKTGPGDPGVEDASMGTAGKLCKVEPQTKTGSHRQQWKVSLKDRQNSRGTGRTSSVESEAAFPAAQVARKCVLDQLNQILFCDDQLPESIILINSTDWQGQYLSEVLLDQPIVCTTSSADVQAAFNAIVGRIQRFCNRNSQTPPTVKVAVGGDPSYLSTVLSCFVEQLASRTPDWLGYICFLILPVGVHPLARNLGFLDARFSSLFLDAGWRKLFGHQEPPPQGRTSPDRAAFDTVRDTVGVAARVSQYLAGATVSHLCPISEAMLTCKSCEDDSCQKFVPFIGTVKVGLVEQSFVTTSVDSDDIILGPPPSQTGAPISTASTPLASPSCSCPAEVMGLQVDYWSGQGGGGGGGADRRKEVVKNTLRSNVCCLQVSRISGEDLLSMTVVTREKNKKVMFLSKKTKEKETESRSHLIEGISRLICAPKHQHTLTVSIDGVEWNDVKFFQLAAQWPTHVKHFPVGIFGYNNKP